MLQFAQRSPNTMAALLIAALVCIRLVTIILSPLNIGPDEAQYWRWSHELDWGYYSKPPLIAWMISLTTSIFGHAEWAIRIYAPIGHGLAAFFLFLLGKKAFDVRTGAWASAVYLLMPGVWLSSSIISTDGLLLPCWSAAITLLWFHREDPKWHYAALMGLAIGLAFLAKYAAIYIVIGIVLTFVIDKKTRSALLSPKSLAIIAAAGAVILPNILWNAANDFATLSHTADNANWENSKFNLGNMFKFVKDQFGVFGPVSFLILLGGLLFILPTTDSESARKDRWFLCFILVALIVITGQAFVSRAHANWAASAYPAASVLIAAWALRANWIKLLKIGVAINAVLGVLFLAITLVPTFADQIGASNAIKRVRAWEASISQLDQAAISHNASGIVFDERENWHNMDYYAGKLDAASDYFLWQRHDYPHAFAESYAPVPADTDDTLLIASVRDNFSARMREDFENFEPVGRLEIPIDQTRKRTFCLFKASGYKPLKRTKEYELKFKDAQEPCPK